MQSFVKCKVSLTDGMLAADGPVLSNYSREDSTRETNGCQFCAKTMFQKKWTLTSLRKLTGIVARQNFCKALLSVKTSEKFYTKEVLTSITSPVPV